MKRIEILDGMRGYFLFFMLINHIVLQGGFWLQDVNLAQVMFVEDAQGFVFLSGFLIGLLQTKRLMRHGVPAMRASVYRRAGELYLYSMGLVLIALTLQAVLPGGVDAFYNWMGASGASDPKRDFALATLIFQPTFMDILPMYILFLLAAPPLVRQVAEGRWPLVITVSLLVWMAAQMGVGDAISVPLQAIGQATDGQGLRGSFNPLGWQLVFISGMVGGGLMAKGGIEWKRIFSPQATTLPVLCLIVVGFFLPVRLITAHDVIEYKFLGPFESMALRPSFGPVYLLNLLGAGGLLAWLLIAGPDSPKRWVRAIAHGLQSLFLWAPLRLLGRHSLQTYAWHVLVVYSVRYIDVRYGPLDELGKTVVALVCIALLPLPALWRDHAAPALRRALATPQGRV